MPLDQWLRSVDHGRPDSVDPSPERKARSNSRIRGEQDFRGSWFRVWGLGFKVWVCGTFLHVQEHGCGNASTPGPGSNSTRSLPRIRAPVIGS